MGEGHELSMADVDSVRLGDPTKVVVAVHGRPKPYEFQMKSETEARELRASLVFYAKFTRGGIPGVEDWRLLLSAAYDRLDISDTAVPSGPMSIQGVEQSGRSAAARPPAGVTAGRKIIFISALVLFAVVAVAVVLVAKGRHGQTVDLEGYERLMLLADAAAARSDYPGALGLYKQALGLDPDSPEANGQAGLCLVRLGRFEEATPYLVASMQSGLKEPSYAAALGLCYAKTNQLDKALSFLRKAYAVFPADAVVNYQLASVLDAQGKTAEALSRAEDVFRNHMEFADNALLYAALLVESGRLADGRNVYLIVARAQHSAEAYLGAARAAGRQADFQGAEQILDESRRYEYPKAEAAILSHTNREILAGFGIELPKPPPAPVVAPPPAAPEDETMTAPAPGHAMAPETNEPAEAASDQSAASAESATAPGPARGP
jgi:tetratricopeptide (TPR) repeat protein